MSRVLAASMITLCAVVFPAFATENAAPSQVLKEWPVTGEKLPPKVALFCNPSSGANAELAAEPALASPQGAGALRLEIVNESTKNVESHIQVYFSAQQALSKGGKYAVEFQVKSSQPVSFPVRVMVHESPFSPLSEECVKTISTTDSEWQKITMPFSPDKDIAPRVVIRTPCFLVGKLPAGVKIWIAAVTLSQLEAAPTNGAK